MEQQGTQKIPSDCGKALLIVDNDMSLGNLHDFLLSVKGHFLQVMSKVQEQEQAELQAQKDMVAKQQEERNSEIEEVSAVDVEAKDEAEAPKEE